MGTRTGLRDLLGGALAVLTAAVMGWAAWQAVRFGIADGLAIRATERSAQVAARAAPPTEDALNALAALIAPAIDVAPEVSDYREFLGSVLFARAELAGRDDEARRTDYRAAAERFREAARRAPGSGFAWANLMLALHRAGGADAECLDALARAVRLAPHERPVQMMVAEVGLTRWPALDARSREQVRAMLGRAWDEAPDALETEARAAPGQEAWCAPPAPVSAPLCGRLAGKP